MPVPLKPSVRRAAVVVWTAITLAMNTHAAEISLFDFQASNNAPAWQIVNDDVMGGVSRSQFQVGQSNAVFSGVVSLENNGGFASVRSTPLAQNLAGADAFVLRVRGDGRSYKFTVRTERSFDSAIYQASFKTKPGEWAEYSLPMEQFVPTFRGRVLAGVPPLDAAKVASVGFLIADKQAGPFRLDIAWIKATKLLRQKQAKLSEAP